jgi:hypothetical protein
MPKVLTSAQKEQICRSPEPPGIRRVYCWNSYKHEIEVLRVKDKVHQKVAQ